MRGEIGSLTMNRRARYPFKQGLWDHMPYNLQNKPFHIFDYDAGDGKQRGTASGRRARRFPSPVVSSSHAWLVFLEGSFHRESIVCLDFRT